MMERGSMGWGWLVGCVVAVEVECGYFKLWGEYKWRRSTAAKSVDS